MRFSCSLGCARYVTVTFRVGMQDCVEVGVNTYVLFQLADQHVFPSLAIAAVVIRSRNKNPAALDSPAPAGSGVRGVCCECRRCIDPPCEP